MNPKLENVVKLSGKEETLVETPKNEIEEDGLNYNIITLNAPLTDFQTILFFEKVLPEASNKEVLEEVISEDFNKQILEDVLSGALNK
uniref:Phage protein n=1 Tax=Rhabditophanes sp. KR3021 TaxID=114890 RepID=A0AC35U7H5_9BILA